MRLDTFVIAVTNEYDAGYHAARPTRRLRLSIDQIRFLIDQAAELGARLLVIGGGEPFLLGKVLDQAVSYAADRVASVRVVTDCYWASKPNRAVVEMDRLAAAGLRELDIRCGDWNQEPKWQHRAKWAAFAAGRAGIAVLSNQLADSAKTGVHVIYLRQYPSAAHEAYRAPIESPDAVDELHPAGLLPYYPAGKDSAPRNPSSVLDDDSGCCPYLYNSITAHPDGKLTACAGHACSAAPDLNLGDWYTRPVAELIKDGERRPVLQWIRVSGPAAVRDAILEKSPHIAFEPSYASLCHLCGDMLARFETRREIHAHANAGVKRALDDLIVRLEQTRSGLQPESPGHADVCSQLSEATGTAA
jgi:hypothetical protein